MELDTLLLSRLQFALTISFHILFPTLTIGLASFLVALEWRWLRRRDRVYLALYRFWLKIFALAFGMGVVSGVVLSYEFGTNFSRFADATGNVLGPLLSYEVLTAFFLEAGFLGIMLFGWNRVGPYLHFASTVLVAIGTVISAFWVLAASSWMHTPDGFLLQDGKFYVADWYAIIFNPSFPYRLAHMLLASYLTTAFFVAGVSAWQLLGAVGVALAGRGYRMALGAAMLLAPLQIVAGDLHGLQVKEHQPIKVAAMEALWETREGAPLLLFAIPDMAAEANHAEIAIPKGASWILTHEPDGRVVGLKTVGPEDRPNVPVVFFAFRLMVGIGFWLLLVAVWAAVLRIRGRLYESVPLMYACVTAAPLGLVATLAGWTVAEVGRQPWIVHGLMRTADSVAPVPAGSVATSLVLFAAIYGLLLWAFLHYLFRMVRLGPEPVDARAEPVGGPARRLAAPAE